MKGVRLLVAAGTLAALLGGYYLYKEVWLAGKQAEEEQKLRLLSMSAEKVENVRIIRPGSEDVVVARENGSWIFEKPFETQVDQGAVNRVVLVAQALSAERNLGRAEDLSEYGLDSPIILEFIHGDEKQTSRLYIGGRNPMTGGAYVTNEENGEVFLAPGISVDDLEVSFFELREKKFFTRAADELVAMEFARKGMEKIRIEKAKDGKWQITSPIKAPASRIAVENLRDKFLRAKASGFHEEKAKDLSIYGLSAPDVTFTAYYTKEDSDSVKMALGSGTGAGAVFALWPDGKKVARIPEDILKDLPRKIMDIRERKLVSFAAMDVRKITISSTDGEVVVEKMISENVGAERWELLQPVETPADSAMVSALINSIRNIGATGFPSGSQGMEIAKKALQVPEMKIGVELKDKELEIRLSGADKQGRYWAEVYGAGEAFMVASSTVNPLRKGLFELRDRRLLTMTSDEVGKIRIERLGQVFEVKKNVDEYMIVRPEKIKLRAGEWVDFVWRILELRFAGVIDEKWKKQSDPSTGEPVMVISIFGTDGTMLERAQIAKAKDDDKWYKAWLDNRPGLYDVDWFYVEDDVTSALEKMMSGKEGDTPTDLFPQ